MIAPCEALENGKTNTTYLKNTANSHVDIKYVRVRPWDVSIFLGNDSKSRQQILHMV